MAKRFTFRAQPALDLRHRELDARTRVLAIAERDRLVARQILEESVAALVSAQGRAGLAMQEATAIDAITWHRLWITRLERARVAHVATVAQKEHEVALAAAECHVARQRVEAMERLKEKSRDAWEHAARLHEQREIDALATMRYVAASRTLVARSTP